MAALSASQEAEVAALMGLGRVVPELLDRPAIAVSLDGLLAHALQASEAQSQIVVTAAARGVAAHGEEALWHGSLGIGKNWPLPEVAASSTADARPGYMAFSAEEYIDCDDVVAEKVKILATLVRQHGRTSDGGVVAYTGAGISTAAGVPDYASRAGASKAPHLSVLGSSRPAKTGRLGGMAALGSGNRLETKPTLSHAALASLESQGLVQHWLQQNHDRLAQKAGFPQAKLNEIHGAWGDHKNSVVQMADTLRPDLLAWMAAWAQNASLVVALGSTLCGMTADHVAEGAAERAQRCEQRGGGLVIINLQRTRLDEVSSLRIWGLCDAVMSMLCRELGLRVPDPLVKRRGEEWESKHPSCKYNTSKRKPNDPL